jgi:hypothetical protein
MAIVDYMRRQRQAQQQPAGAIQTQPGDPNFSLATNPSSQAQFPAAAGESRLQDVQGRATNALGNAYNAGYDTSAPAFDPLNEASQQGFTQRALTLGEGLLGWIDGPRQAVNLLIQDIAGGEPEDLRNPNFGDYWNTLWGGMEDEEGFMQETGLNPRSGSHTIDMFGWSPEDDFLGRAARGVVDFGFQILTDPLTYVTFGLSGLGKKAAQGAARALQKESVDAIMPILKSGIVDDAALVGLTDYQRYLVNNIDAIQAEFGNDMLGFVDNLGGDFAPDVKRGLNRYLGEDGNPWAKTTELAIANRIANEVMKPLIARNFRAINPLARAELPLWARGGARISIPFTQNNLRHGAQIPGTIGVGKSLIGDPLREVSRRLKAFGPYNTMANRIESAKNAMDQWRPLLEGLKTPGSEGIAGWQYHIAMDALDSIHNQGAKEFITATLGAKFKTISDLAEGAGLDISEVNSLIMNRLESVDINGVALRQAGKLFGEGGVGQDLAGDWGRLYPDLDKEVDGVAAFLRGTFDEYHEKLSMLDPRIKERYIDGYTPHKGTKIGAGILDELAVKGAAPPRGEWINAPDPGRGLFARLIAARGKGGRLETSMGAARYMNEREIGRLQALTLLDDGVMLLDQEWAENFLRTQARGLMVGGEVNINALETRYIPASKLNEILEPVVREQAKRHGVVIPGDWDGKIFSEDPFEVAADYVGNMDEAIRMLTAVDTFRTAGLAMNHSTAVDVQDVIQKLFENVVKHTEAVSVAKFGRPDPDNHMAPVSWLKTIVDPEDWEAAKVRGTGLEPGTDINAAALADADDPALRPLTVKKAEYDKGLEVGSRKISDAVYGTREEFQASVQTEGVRVPLNVGITPSGNVILIDGHNRLLAAEAAGLEEMPVRITMMSGEDELAEATGVNVSHYMKKNLEESESDLGSVVDKVTGRPLVPGTGRLTLAEAFNILPWDPSPFITQKNILKGSMALGNADIPLNVQSALRKAGISTKDIGEARNMLQMAKMSRAEFLKLSPLAQSPRLMSVPLEGTNMRVTVNAAEELEITFKPGMDMTERRIALEDAILKLDSELKSGILKGKLTNKGMRDLASKTVDETTSRVLYRYLNRKLAALPPSVSEWITKDPAELVQTRALFDTFEDELNYVVTNYAALQTRSGQLVTDSAQLKLLGNTELENRLRILRDSADQLGDAGYDTAAKLMRGIDDFTSVADPGFVSPSMFALAGPAVDDVVLQKDLAMFLRNVARNSAMMYTPEGIAAAKTATRNGLRWWRAMATIARPSFHIRNLVGGAWMNLVHGVQNSNYAMVAHGAPKVRAALRAGKTLDQAFDTLPADAREVFRAAWEDDIMSGFASTEFRKLTAGQKREKLAWMKVWDVDDFVLTRMGGRFMESIEDLLRVSLYARYFDPAKPATRSMAKDMVNATHFDYVNLTPMETRLKSWIPFFVWTRRNLPRQIQLAVENPRYVQKYRAMMQSMNDNLGGDENALMPEGDSFSAHAAGTDYFVNPNTPFWARVMIDPDLPIADLISLPTPGIDNLVDYANDLLGPHVSTLVNVNEQRDFGDVNAPAPFNAILKSLAAVGLYDETMDGDVRIPYFMRSILETALPFGREVIDPLTGGPSDPNRQQRLGIKEDDNTLTSIMKNIAGVGLSGLGVKLTTPADVRGVAARTNEELDQLIQELRLQGAFPASEG